MSTINNGVLHGPRRVGPSVREIGVNGGTAGAPLGMRFRGATPGGAPQTGSWKQGDQVSDRAGAIWICTAGGTPGTWVQAGGGMAAPTDTPTAGAVEAAVGSGSAWGWGKLTPALIGSSRTSTLVVAASNATAKSKAAADYVCTGTSSTGGDNATIQTALRALNTAGGGRLILTEGIYWRSNPVYADGSRIIIEGQGDSTQFTVATGAAGSAHFIIGSNGAYDGVTYLGGDTAPVSVPQEVTVRGVLLQDYQSAGVALAGSASGLISRGSVVHLSDVNVKGAQLDGLRWEGFRQMGNGGTLGAAVSTTPAWGTSETWTVTMSSPPAPQFTCIVTPAGGGDNDPEIVNVTNVSGTTWTVQRGWMQTTAKTHASGDSVTVLNVTTVFNNVARDCYIYSPLRAGLLTQQGLDDSEWFGCLINGGSNSSAEYTTYGIWGGGSNCRYVACHAYFCNTNGYYGNPQTGGAPIHIIIGGEYETCGSAGISLQQAAHSVITGGVQMYANGTYDILLSSVADFSISDVSMYSAGFRHIQANNCTQGSIHDNRMSGQNSGYMIQISGGGASVNAELDIHDNVFAASGSSYANALNLSNVAGVRVHDNVLEEGILESGTSDYNLITSNQVTNPAKGITVSGAHTRSYDNAGAADYIYSAASTVAALSDQMYQLNGTSNTITLSPPGSGAGATTLAGGSTGVALPVTTITLSSAPAGWPASGIALIPVTGGYALVTYQFIAGAVLSGCTGGTGTTVSGSAYICPDAALKFKAVASNTANAVTIACPPGMTINGAGTALTLTSGHLYTAVLGITSTGANWAIY